MNVKETHYLTNFRLNVFPLNDTFGRMSKKILLHRLA